jgi:hypothetical protein
MLFFILIFFKGYLIHSFANVAPFYDFWEMYGERTQSAAVPNNTNLATPTFFFTKFDTFSYILFPRFFVAK